MHYKYRLQAGQNPVQPDAINHNPEPMAAWSQKSLDINQVYLATRYSSFKNRGGWAVCQVLSSLPPLAETIRSTVRVGIGFIGMNGVFPCLHFRTRLAAQ